MNIAIITMSVNDGTQTKVCTAKVAAAAKRMTELLEPTHQGPKRVTA